MNEDNFDLRGAYEGGLDVQNNVDNILRSTISTHYVITFAILVVLVIVILYLTMKKEGFNPTQHLRFADSDQYALGHERFTKGQLLPGDPSLPASQPGSAAYNVLHSNDFDCSGRKAVGDNAWDWMYGVANESFTTLNKPPTDNTFSRTLSGY